MSEERLRDAVFCSGLLMIGIGLWWIRPAMALIVIGTAFVAIAVAGWWLHKEVK